MATAAFVRVRRAPRIRRAWPHEAPALAALAVRAQATWGYGPAEMRVFEAALSVEPGQLRPGRAFVLEAWERVAGFYTLVEREPGVAELAHLFVDPALMGRGFGTQLLAHACEQARRAGFVRLHVRSDPHAERFYRMRGAARLRRVASHLPGGLLPLLEIELRG
ncbi:MAG: GNAT family N-acetyltransferase [Myxococcota bacterium]|nr:GNAT family N-acetyltransferase [Myxococcota bacterium]